MSGGFSLPCWRLKCSLQSATGRNAKGIIPLFIFKSRAEHNYKLLNGNIFQFYSGSPYAPVSHTRGGDCPGFFVGFPDRFTASHSGTKGQ